MKTMRSTVATAVIATITGTVLGGVVATAMGRNLHLYLRFVGVLVVAALGVVGVWVYRTYLRPPEPAVEDAEVDSPS